MKLEKLNSKIFKAVSNEELVKMEGGRFNEARWSGRQIKRFNRSGGERGLSESTTLGIEDKSVAIYPTPPSDSVLDAAAEAAFNAQFLVEYNTGMGALK